MYLTNNLLANNGLLIKAHKYRKACGLYKQHSKIFTKTLEEYCNIVD